MNARAWAAGQRGTSTVAVAGMVVAALLLATGIFGFSAASRAAMQAGTAADMAALAAADTARGLRSGDACATAGLLVTANDAHLESCAVEADGTTVRVAVYVPVEFSALGITLYRARAQARAGAPPLTR